MMAVSCMVGRKRSGRAGRSRARFERCAGFAPHGRSAPEPGHAQTAPTGQTAQTDIAPRLLCLSLASRAHIAPSMSLTPTPGEAKKRVVRP